MKLKTFIAADNIISPFGFTSEENFEQLKKMKTAVKQLLPEFFLAAPVCAACIDPYRLNTEFNKLAIKEIYTRLEQMVILSITAALKQNKNINITSKKTLLIITTTKGNIDLLDDLTISSVEKKRVFLWKMAAEIGNYFNTPNTPLVISNACISGVLGIIAGKRLLEDKQYETIIVTGVDILTQFVIAGFQSFKVISPTVAKPYDMDRDGISLGEGCGTLVLTNNKNIATSNFINQHLIQVKGGASANDANHISGPSRNGEGLLLTIKKTLAEAAVSPNEVDYICGHGTATVFNDEMEAIAIHDAQLATVPMNSLKSFFGHTLGAAGIIESIIAIHSMRKNTLIGTYNFKKLGVSKPITVIKETTQAKVNTCLKTAAGFGGCNASVLFQKIRLDEQQ